MGLTIREMMTGEERHAIAELKRIAKRWPRSLALIAGLGSTDLRVARNPLPDRLADAETIDRIPLRVDYHER